ncbi:hypothetical protein [uncultured Thiodictyon sp.]|jgi:outer membrane protein OmpA-like peptidoglycan-associated protein|uniref:hypothetical protein n=1 Tax=uncultured Thiodictyon sp. TaxID=1846217 RepID=UPI0025E0B0F7|nr:hypothetical protein [uncultured Thiodictyon sp.]
MSVQSVSNPKGRERFGQLLPALDLILLVVMFLIIAVTAVMMVIRAYILPLEKVQTAEAARLQLSRVELLRLCDTAKQQLAARVVPEEDAGALARLCVEAGRADPPLDRPAAVQAANVLHRLRRIGTAAGQLETLAQRIETLADQVKGLMLRGEVTRVVRFWQERAKELCPLQEEVPTPPTLPATAGLGDLLLFGQAAQRYGLEVWALHDKCVESKKVVIGEDLLRFQYDRSDAFNMTEAAVEQAKQRIRELVDNARTEGGFRQIFVEGHCDPKGGEDYNYQLSFMRALYVAGIIREHLKARQLNEGPGKDFELHVLGYSFQRPLARTDGEAEADWHSRLRRIEIGFRRSR